MRIAVMPLIAHLNVTGQHGQRRIAVRRLPFILGRGTRAGLYVASSDISRAHAEISAENDGYVLRDGGSRFGTFVNEQALSGPRQLRHGDRIRLGRHTDTQIVFLLEEEADESHDDRTGAVTDFGARFTDFREMAAVLNGLRALGSGGVLDEVLTLVLDSAIDVTTAERGFIMLADAGGTLDLRIARGRHRQTLSGQAFTTSQKIPQQVYETGQSLFVDDLLEHGFADAHAGTVARGIRHVLCVPLTVSAFSATERAALPRTIGVLYLDAHARGTLLSESTRLSLDAFATQAAIAIDSARLYAEAAEKAKLERELRVAAGIQVALLPEPRRVGGHYALAASSVPCETIGGDFFDYLDLEGGQLAVTLGDVAGKGPPAALLAATVLSSFFAAASAAGEPAAVMAGINRTLLHRDVKARFVTLFAGVLDADGTLIYCNAGHEPPLIVRQSGSIDQLALGGPAAGIIRDANYTASRARLDAGDLLVCCSDGVTEARNQDGEEFGSDRLRALIATRHGDDPSRVLDELIAAVHAFADREPQTDDITALVLRYSGLR